MLPPPDPDDTRAHARWRAQKLETRPADAAELLTEINDPVRLTGDERTGLSRSLARANLALYRCRRPVDRAGVAALAAQAGLTRTVPGAGTGADGITSLRAETDGPPSAYIPYSRRPLNWHTDGYYTPPAERICGFLLHCVAAAESGGENRLLDHELAWLALYDRDPAHVRALLCADVLTIPANRRGDTVLRPAVSGPVFYRQGGRLHMRYTHRTRSAAWREDPATGRARAALADILATSPWVLRHTLAPDEGILCNNVLHARDGFTDTPAHTRHLYRVRARDPVHLAA